MEIAATALTALVALLHFGFLYMETLGWDKMARRFGQSPEATEITRPMALNQGFYNAGLASVLLWALLTGAQATVIAMLLYVIAMAVVGAASVNKRIFIIQGVPAVLALGATLLA